MAKMSDLAEFDLYAVDYDKALAAGISVTGEDKDYFALFIFPRALNWSRGVEPTLSRLPLGGQYQALCRKPE